MAEESKIVGVLDGISAMIDSASGALETLNEKALKGGLGFDVLIKSVETSTQVFDKLLNAVGAVGSAFTLGLDFGLIQSGFSKLGGIFKFVMGTATGLVKIFNSVGKGIDSVTGFSRELNASLFESTAKFNGSFNAAKKFADYIIDSSQKFASAEFGFISPAERIAAVKGLEQAGIPLVHMTDSIDSAAGSMDLLNTAFLQSKSLGLEISQFMDLLGNAMMTQGLNSQEAAEQMALFGDVAQATGFRVDKVARSLQGISTRFAKLGVTANFGAPILEAFTSSLTSMGFGFENAIDLSETLSGSLAKLSSDYAAAFVTFQRGGLDMGGGSGALGASISLRAKMADKDTDQGQLAIDMAGALKETISSFTGGQIVNVKQAADNPALQQTFFTQTQLLKDLYGITDAADQDRTLELLQQLGDATARGDTELAASLGEDLQNTMESRDETLGFAEKTTIASEGTYAELQSLNKILIEGFRLSGDSLTGLFTDMQKDALKSDEVQALIRDANSKSPEETMFDFGAGAGKLKDMAADASDRLLERLNQLPEASDLISALQSATLNVINPSGDAIMSDVSTAVKEMTIQILKYLNDREAKQIGGYNK